MEGYGLTVADLCDMVYMIHLDRVERVAISDRTVTGESITEALEKFEQELNAVPASASNSDDAQLRRALGMEA